MQMKPPTKPRVPEECPRGFFRYTVRPGDTIFRLAQRLGVDDGLIIANNPQIPDPAVLFPGDVLCLPVPISFPCIALLQPVAGIPREAAGVILVRRLADGRQSAAVTAAGLPDPATLGDFNAYAAETAFAGIGIFGFLLSPIPGEDPAWAGTLIVPRPIFYAGVQVTVRPVNTQTGAEGAPALEGDLRECARPVDLLPD